MEPLYEVHKAAKLLAVSPWTVRAYIRQGKLQPIRIGRLVRLEAQELESFIDAAKDVNGQHATVPEGEAR